MNNNELQTLNNEEAQIIIDAPVYPVSPTPETKEYANRTEDESRELARKILNKWRKGCK